MPFKFLSKALSSLGAVLSGAKKDADAKFTEKSPEDSKVDCPLEDKIKLVEFVEVVTRGGKEGVVTDPGAASAKLPTLAQRTAKDGGKYQQFINLEKDIDGDDNRHPDHERYIEIKARVEWVSGDKSRPLSGKKVHFTYKLTKDSKRPAALVASEKEGFGSSGGPAEEIATTDADGWTSTTKFYLSQFGGDSFAVEAQADENDSGKASGTKLKIDNYQVWRKFWYQRTNAVGFNPPAMTVSETAYKKVFAVMEKDDELVFKPEDTPANTFYPEWQLKVGGGDKQVAVIGGHNSSEFYKLFKQKPEKPVKAHLIVCEYQWDPARATPLQTFEISKSPSDELQLVQVARNAGLVNPALEGDLLIAGTYTSLAPSGHADFGKTGNLSNADIEIVKGRSSLTGFKVKLPAGAPDPTAHPVKVQMKFNYARYWGGESRGYQIIITYKGNKNSYDHCVSHELGHAVYQTPRNGKQTKKPESLPDHPKYYTDDRGGQGPHCSTGATSVVEKDYPLGRFNNGSCIMYHQLNPTGCKQVFCSDCDPYLKLQDMSELKPFA